MKIRNSIDTSRAAAPIDQASANANVSRPEFFRLPATGGDPFFGLTRSYYYEGEQRGYWRLVRLRERGKQRGVTLIPFDVVAKFVRDQMLKPEARRS